MGDFIYNSSFVDYSSSIKLKGAILQSLTVSVTHAASYIQILFSPDHFRVPEVILTLNLVTVTHQQSYLPIYPQTIPSPSMKIRDILFCNRMIYCTDNETVCFVFQDGLVSK